MTVRTARLVTLGCKVNQYETQYVKELLEANGWTEAAEGEPANLCIVNTCTVTHEGDAKGRQLIRRLHQANPSAHLVVMGCYATRDPDAVRRLPGVSQVITDKERLVEEFAPLGISVRPQGISRFDDHQRAFVKVQDGCLLNCSYCIIPTVRPVLRSRSVEEITEEVSRLIAAGHREIVLTGIHLGHYGLDISKGLPKEQWTRLWHLLDRLASLPGDFRLRLSSLEAAEARDDLIAALARHPRICPHLHLCLQSGSDRVLAAMKRRYRSGGFLRAHPPYSFSAGRAGPQHRCDRRLPRRERCRLRRHLPGCPRGGFFTNPRLLLQPARGNGSSSYARLRSASRQGPTTPPTSGD